MTVKKFLYLQSCWNCGRKASETCSGCNVARYCGSFCQHKDWERHHRVCGQTGRVSEQPGEQPVQPTPVCPRSEPINVTVSSPVRESSPTQSVVSEPQSGSRSSSPVTEKKPGDTR